MGTDIHAFVERKSPSTGDWEVVKSVSPFNWRDYGIFGFLGNVRNYSGSDSLSDRRGLPADVSPEVQAHTGYGDDYHSHSWLLLKELLEFDYDKVFRDRRAEWEEEAERQVTYREHLLGDFFRDVDELKALGDPESVRVVFWFDN